MEFIPFKSIETWSNKRYIDRRFRHEPKLKDALYAVTEKIDGANFSVIIERAPKQFRYFSRNREIQAEKPFFGAPEELKIYQEDFKKIQNALGTMKCQSLTVRGELYGLGINNRIAYGDKKQFAPFIIEKDGKPETYHQFRGFMADMQFTHLKPVPVLADNVSFEEALAFNPENLVTRARMNTKTPSSQAATASAEPTVHDCIEGVVIQPCDSDGEPFLLKKRAKQYLEIEKKGPRLGKNVQSDKKTDANSFSGFSNYVTENRLINVISNIGELTPEGNLGDYINQTIKDAKIDYCKNNPEVTMEDRLPKKENQLARQKIVSLLQIKYPECFTKKHAK
nr:RNA ligase family protein [Endozoicomonas sp. ONNA2]